MKLIFLGTRGEIDLRTRLHRMHSCLAVSYRNHGFLIDCGADWLHKIRHMRPHAIVLTHAHPDHAWGLKKGAPCKVYATPETWHVLEKFPIADRVAIQPRCPFRIYEMTLEAFPVEHSIHAPAVGYRITAGRSAVFYVPDLVYIYDVHEALRGVRIYIGDGASLRRPIVRKSDSSLVGHAAILMQLAWCEEEGVPKALFTHCGSQIVRARSRDVGNIVLELGSERGVSAQIAIDGMEITLP